MIGAGAAVLLVVGGGGVVAVNAFGGGDSAGSKTDGGDDDKHKGDANLLADANALIDAPTVKSLTPAGAWAISATADGSTAPDKSFVCQPQRFADPAGIRTWVRNFRNPTTRDTAVQYVEVSNDSTAAGKTYTTITGWLSACVTPQMRLVASYSTTGLGERGIVAIFGQPTGEKTSNYRTISVSTAGQATMVLEYDSSGTAVPKPDGVLSTAGAGLKRICDQPGAGCTTGTPSATPALLPSSESPGFMAPIDLPVLTAVNKPWVSATSTTRSGTGCEKIDLKKAKAIGYKSLTYVTPDADVPTEFGLDATVSKYASPAAATAFVTGIRKNVDGCAKASGDAVTVKTTDSITVGSIKGEAWRAAYDTGGGKVATYRIGIASNGSSAVYVLFPVLKNLDISDKAFTDVLTRAAERAPLYK
ncbi:hypothetical protein F1D05_26130 [Kribbella qitaiheensis]|uniref:Sensor domain-containing protein n=1 Tax=Kribbella qitaiheensis TaxID=1544730 RepID=A0A7G6XA97_9ACTN|nr:hypothetical protein F1D05_26130 [Kribbella qitaiheensis]